MAEPVPFVTLDHQQAAPRGGGAGPRVVRLRRGNHQLACFNERLDGMQVALLRARPRFDTGNAARQTATAHREGAERAASALVAATIRSRA